ncbi:hypothetical protein GX586_03880, partial [bacterium]|nr:hypothetical protein [bacterium]
SRTAPAPEGPWSATAKPVRTVDNPESPFVVRYGDGYYLWQQMPVIYSTNYLDFNGPLVAHMTKQWFSGRYAPEILHHNGQYYVSGYSSGIWLARMRWEIEEVDDADLLVLETSGATLSPPFYRTTTWYTASAAYTVTNTMQTYIAADAHATVLINGAPSVGSRSNTVDLAVGANLVELDITAASSAHKEYSVLVTRAANPSVLSPQTSAGQISVIEGGTNTFGVRLNANPGGTVTVTVARVYGDADIKVIGGGTLVFTAANHGAYQTVSVTAEYDPDRADGVALIQCAASGMDALNVLVRESDERAGTVIPIDVDFGAIPSTGMWNNLSSHAPGAVLTNVKARNGMALPTAVNINGGFTSSFTNGIAQGPFPPSAQQDGFMVPPGATASVVITGLEDAWTYDFTLFGSAFVPQDDFRTRYAAGAAEAVLNTADNTANTATLGNLAPGAGGTLVLGIARAGTATADRAALNALVIDQKPSGGTAYFDFGPTATPGYWNNVTTPEEGVKVVNAIDSAGVPTGVELAITAAFYTAISGATEGIDTNTLYPATVQVDCLRTSGAEVGAFQLRGLNPARRFDVAFYGAAWRTGTRGSDYTVNGTTVRLSATANYWNLAIVSNVAPDGSGTIHVSVRTMPGASWSYLNAMELRPSGDTVPARTFLVDCGVPALPTTGAWNNLAAHETGASLSNLVDDTGAASALALTVQDGFAEASLCGVDASDVFPSSAQRDGFTLDSTDTNALIVITGLPTNTTFDITCFGSLETALPDRRTRYAIDGRPAVLDARNNAAATVRIPDVTSQLGQVTLTIASAGTNAADAGCINVLCIEAVTPEPAAAALFALLALVAIKASRSW